MAETSTSTLLRNAQHDAQEGRERILILLAFFCIYVIWGSTYLAVHYAVETIPPLYVAGLRHLFAGGLLFAWCWSKGLRPGRQQWFASLILGVLFFLIGHGTMHWAMRTIPSGLAALLIATEPIWIAIMTTATHQARINLQLLIGLALGIFGVSLLINASGGESTLVGSIAVLVGAFSWALGVIYSRSPKLHPDAIMSAAMSLLAGAALLLLTGTLAGEASQFSLSAVSLKSLLALAYLTIMGSLVCYSAYFWLLQRCPPTLVATHTYVNPIVALVLGWAVAGEMLTWRTIISGAAVVGAIGLVKLGAGRKAQVSDAEKVCTQGLGREAA